VRTESSQPSVLAADLSIFRTDVSAFLSLKIIQGQSGWYTIHVCSDLLSDMFHVLVYRGEIVLINQSM
jgi:hypothetical protein